jgi:hypothetical protein
MRTNLMPEPKRAQNFESLISTLQNFVGTDLTQTLSQIETSLRGTGIDTCSSALQNCGAANEVLGAAGAVKRIAGQINVVVHALGILLCLPHLLRVEEVIKYVSLGAGNTGRDFDLETNFRIAEFKFIRWQGGPESIRQNALFKDFYVMAEHRSEKEKFLYVLDTKYPLKFLNGGRALSSVLSRNVKLQKQFLAAYGDQYKTVRDYYLPRSTKVKIEDVSNFVPELVAAALDDQNGEFEIL